MKIFKDLSIGDTIYVINKNTVRYDQGFFKERTVVDLARNSDGGLIVNNNRYDRPFLVISKKVQKKSTYNFDGLLYLVNKEELKPFIRKAVLEEINNQEESIPRRIKAVKETIESLRKTYWEYLN